MKLFALTIGIVMAVITPLALAITPGYYGVVDVGQSSATKACDTTLISYAGASNYSCTNKATSWGPSIGYQFNENLALEGGYTHMGKFSYSYDTTACIGCTVASSQEFSGLRFSVIGYLPPSNNFALFGKVGINRWTSKNTGNILTMQNNYTDNGGGLLLGFGAKYEIKHNLAARFQFESQKVGGYLRNIDTLSIGLIFQ